MDNFVCSVALGRILRHYERKNEKVSIYISKLHYK